MHGMHRYAPTIIDLHTQFWLKMALFRNKYLLGYASMQYTPPPNISEGFNAIYSLTFYLFILWDQKEHNIPWPFTLLGRYSLTFLHIYIYGNPTSYKLVQKLVVFGRVGKRTGNIFEYKPLPPPLPQPISSLQNPGMHGMHGYAPTILDLHTRFWLKMALFRNKYMLGYASMQYTPRPLPAIKNIINHTYWYA